VYTLLRSLNQLAPHTNSVASQQARLHRFFGYRDQARDDQRVSSFVGRLWQFRQRSVQERARSTCGGSTHSEVEGRRPTARRSQAIGGGEHVGGDGETGRHRALKRVQLYRSHGDCTGKRQHERHGYNISHGLSMFNDTHELLTYLDRMHGRTRALIACIQTEDVDWAPAPQWFTFGALVRHMAGMERWMWAETIAGRPSRYPGHGPELARDLDALTTYVDRLHEESRAVFAQLTDEDLKGPVATPGGATLSCWKWVRSMIEHEAHHRGQLYLMLAMRGVATPPIFGLTAEEVHARSLPPAVS